ncbi:MAG: capsular polysaccharide export protein, partial [Psychrobacter okhotskensis]
KPLAIISQIPSQFKRRAATHFMQQRHQWQQRLRKLSR